MILLVMISHDTYSYNTHSHNTYYLQRLHTSIAYVYYDMEDLPVYPPFSQVQSLIA